MLERVVRSRALTAEQHAWLLDGERRWGAFGRPSCVWMRGDAGLLGWGVAACANPAGPARFALAEAGWRAICAGLTVDDEVASFGSGPVAMVSFGFADDPGESVLVLPERLLGWRGDQAWLTTVGDADADPPPLPTLARPAPAPVRVAPAPGQLEAWRQAVAEAVRRIRGGALDKVVLALALETRADDVIDPSVLAQRLSGAYRQCYTFLVDGLVGATPELLVRRCGPRVESQVLAGTAPVGGCAGGELLRSAKDREEHRYAVESLVDTLAPRCVGLEVGPPHLLSLPNVVHLATDVAGLLRQPASVLELAGALHPTAAVGGAPRAAALAAMAELEPIDRRRYAAPVGWVDADGDGELGLALRCAEVRGSTARLYAGCGIVAGSDPAEELAEALAKLAPMRDALAGNALRLGPGPSES
ncbi:MAG: isochorismate synthase MenF [Acidimicrobiales bacterium]